MKRLSPLSYDYVDRIAKMKELSLMTPIERTHHVNISNTDLFFNVFVLVVLLAAFVYFLTGGQ